MVALVNEYSEYIFRMNISHPTVCESLGAEQIFGRTKYWATRGAADRQ